MVDLNTVILRILNYYDVLAFGHHSHNREWIAVSDKRWLGNLNVIGAKFYRQEKSVLKTHPLQTQHIHEYGFDILPNILESPNMDNCSSLYRVLYGDEEGTHLQNKGSVPIDATRLNSLSDMMSMSKKLVETNGYGMDEDKQHLMSTLFLGGFSRRIDIDDDKDWDLFKRQLLEGERAAKAEDSYCPGSSESLYIAVSYKHKDDTFFWKMRLNEQSEAETTEIKVEKSEDILFDSRWDQLKRCTRELGHKDGKHTAYLWIDRLVFLGTDENTKKEYLSHVDWSSFGLWPYMVCSVVRLYNPNEKEYLSSFWRKIELYLGINGKGVIVDDYMLNTYDNTFYFGEGAVKWYRGGTSKIGGDNVYVRSTVLALAQVILEDGIAITKSNEHPNTRKSISQWKKWAIWTICRNMYGHGPVTPMAPVNFERGTIDLDLKDFKRIVHLARVTRNSSIIGNICPIDLAIVRATQARNVSTWDGVREWIGFDDEAYSITHDNKREILEYIDKMAEIEPFAASTGHRATAITLCKEEFTEANKGIVVETSRYSSLKEGHVLSISSFTTETSGRSLIRNYSAHVDPDKQQVERILSTTGWGVIYHPCRYYGIVERCISLVVVLLGIALVIFGFGFNSPDCSACSIVYGFGFVLLAGGVILAYTQFPCQHIAIIKIFWGDKQFIGEGIVDNIVLHKTYCSGVKSKYRLLGKDRYLNIGWPPVPLQEKTSV